ncbi:uncharacterized protein BDZ83DRAFT_751180 [Colletotrichum acutatum]|uniref:Uncharacterized protein n=1 Tax=Glomerella acutata TaxID=27357 RepID=A0AAD8UTQ2_GLOAC|nr:uncharacterized protein BDZ83DRAFT_751180 [Colletotrichum acutatum]KAK1726145.1 hypothetical protein BDZ83DRAFT_751180 [Colletotrichum acutatum]
MTMMRRRATSEDAKVEVQKTEPAPASAVAAVSCLRASPPSGASRPFHETTAPLIDSHNEQT